METYIIAAVFVILAVGLVWLINKPSDRKTFLDSRENYDKDTKL